MFDINFICLLILVLLLSLPILLWANYKLTKVLTYYRLIFLLLLDESVPKKEKEDILKMIKKVLRK